jgi:hypothetical protein
MEAAGDHEEGRATTVVEVVNPASARSQPQQPVSRKIEVRRSATIAGRRAIGSG